MKHIKKIVIKRVERKNRRSTQLSCPVIISPSETV